MSQMSPYTVAWCPYCDQGNIVILKDSSNGELFLFCEECETEWDDPWAIELGLPIHLEPNGKALIPSMEEMKKKDWAKWITERPSFLGWIDANLPEIRDSILFQTYLGSAEAEFIFDTYYFTNGAKGIDMIAREDLTVQAIHFFGVQTGEVAPFPGKLPYGVHFSIPREAVRQWLGVPTNSGGGVPGLLYPRSPIWDRYLRGKFFMHFEYSEDLQRIELFTISSAKGDVLKKGF